jgi:hypothetical protein
MDEATLVGFRQPLGYLDREFDCFVDFQRPAFNLLPERLASEVLHTSEHLAIVCLIDIVTYADVAVLKCGCGLGLMNEAVFGFRIASEFGRKKLESYRAVKFEVLGSVDDTHPPAAEVFEDLVV